jgi:hypothetical protein
MQEGMMDPASLETVSRWASVAAVVLSALAAIAITIAAYASSRVLTVTNTHTEQVRAEPARSTVSGDANTTETENAQAALAVAGELKSDDRPARPELARATGSKPVSAESPVATTGQAIVSVLHAAVSPPQVELSWVADPDSYARAKEIGSALEEAGWPVTLTGSVLIPSNPAATSITAGVLSEEVLLLRKALETAGVKLSILFEPAIPPDRVRLMIGNDQ